jgi:hypothetical protein
MSPTDDVLLPAEYHSTLLDSTNAIFGALGQASAHLTSSSLGLALLHAGNRADLETPVCRTTALPHSSTLT